MSEELDKLADNLKQPSAWIRIIFMLAFSVVLYLIIAPILAFLGFGVWAIVIAHLLEKILITAVLLYYAPFLPSLT